jgi:hypothetical protein
MSGTATMVPSQGFAAEGAAFSDALEDSEPGALTGCEGWTAHELAAHVVGVALEIAINLEAYGSGEEVPVTRSFEEREAPLRAMGDGALRSELPGAVARMAQALDAVLVAEPDAVVPWTGRQMVVQTFITHVRSEFALHRWDLVGDDEVSNELLSQPELTDHAVAVLGRVLVGRCGIREAPGFEATVATLGTADVVVVVDADGARLKRTEPGLAPAVIGDAAARLLFLWGRRPADRRRLVAPQGCRVLAQVEGLLAGY